MWGFIVLAVLSVSYLLMPAANIKKPRFSCRVRETLPQKAYKVAKIERPVLMSYKIFSFKSYVILLSHTFLSYEANKSLTTSVIFALNSASLKCFALP